MLDMTDAVHRMKHSAYVVCISLLLTFSTTAQSFSAYTNEELDQLEREFVQEINHSDAVLLSLIHI